MKRILGITLSLVVLPLVAVFVCQQANSRLPESALKVPQKMAPAQVSAAYGSLPLSFEANQGQTDARVQFLSRGNGYNLFLTRDEAVLSLAQEAKAMRSSVVRMRLVGANRSAAVDGLDELPGKSAYFVGRDPGRWRSEIPNYARVQYREVFPGVDLVYYGHQGRLEYDFVLAPGADPSRIRIAFEGAQKLRLENGDVVVKIAGGDVRLHRPVLYQRYGEEKKAVDGRFVLASNREVSFAVGAYDKREALVIDPSLVYSTYLGGKNLEKALGVAADREGNAYVTGSTASADFPTTAGALQQKMHSADTGAFVTKLNPTGTALVYSTYLGGGNSDVGRAIAVNEKGEAFVVGSTYSVDFPTTAGAAQRMSGGGRDGFVAKLSADGSRLIYASYLGGSGDDEARGIALSTTGEAHVVGTTESANFPGATREQKAACAGGCSRAFVVKMNASGSSLMYATFLGGSGRNSANAIALDLSGAAYIAGHTYAKDFAVTAGVFQTNSSHTACSGRECADVFVMKLSTNGVVLYASRFGGQGDQTANAIAVDTRGNAYVAGRTDSTNFATTANAYQSKLPNHAGSAFVIKLNPMGSGLVYSTYLGGASSDEAMGIAVDERGRAVVAGATSSTTFPTTSSALQRTLAGTLGAFLASLNERGTALGYSTLLSGSRSDGATAVALDSQGNVYVVGNTESKNFPISHGLHGTLDGQGSAFVAKISLPASGGFAQFAPNPLTFANVPFGSTSAAQTSTLSNTSKTNTFTINTISITGTNPADFATTAAGTCHNGLTIAALGSCTVSVTYTPRVSGGESAIVAVASDAVNSPTQLFLQGNGSGPFATLSTKSLVFQNQAPGTPSAAQNVTLKNSGTATLSGIAISKTGTNLLEYTVTTSPATNCGGSLAVGASCTISVVFKPAAGGIRTATISIADNAFGSPQTISLTGNPPILALTPGSVVFPSTPEGTVAKVQTVTFTNKAQFTSLTFTSATVADTVNYQAATNCPAVVPPSGTCSITVGFQPQKASGSFPSTLTIVNNSFNNPNAKLNLSGSASAAPVAKLSVSSLTFTTPMLQATPHLPAAQTLTFTVTNSGSGPLNVSFACAANVCSNGNADFTIVAAASTPCGTSFIQLAQGASCTAAVQFTPQGQSGFGFGPFTGTRTGVLILSTNAGNGNSQSEVFLSGTATGSGQTQICLQNSNPCATTVNFGNVVATSPTLTSAQQVVVVKNTGNVAITINLIFFQRFNGVGTAQFTVNAPPINQCMPNGQQTTLAPGATCNIGLVFNPTLGNPENGLRQTGIRTDILVVRDNAGNNRFGNSDHYVRLIGNATGVPAALVSTGSVVFGSQAMGTVSARKTITLKNTGTTPLFIFNIFTRTGDFQLPTSLIPCPVGQQPGLAVGATCNIDITFGPQNAATGGTRADVVTVQTNAGNNNTGDARGSQMVSVTGNATGAAQTLTVTFSTTGLNFPSQPVATLGAPMNLVITNTSNFPFTSVTTNQFGEFGSSEFEQLTNCGNPNIPTGGACTLTVYFEPFVVGPRSDILDIFVSGPGGGATLRIPMSGTGTGTQTVGTSVPSLTFSAGTPIGGVSISQQFTITNTGTAATAINSGGFNGGIFILPFYNALGDQSDFAESDNCPRNQFFPPGASCVVTVTFTPQPALSAATVRTATLFIEESPNNANIETLGGSVLNTQTVALSGTIAGSPALTVTPASVQFMDLTVSNGDNSNPVVLTLKNTGTATLSPMPNFQSLVGEFGFVNNNAACPSLPSLSPGETCNLWLVYRTNTLGRRVDALVITGNMGNTPSIQAVPLSAFVGP